MAEGPLVVRGDLGRGWIPASMINNEERLDPYVDDPASEAIRALRTARRLTALDEGTAWRRRADGALAVCRVEAFATLGADAHRAAWQEHAPACLDAVWRARWRERDRAPSWIEARWRDADGLAVPPALDWLEVEDQTGSSESGTIQVYEHLTVWSDRFVVTVTIRHEQGEPVDDEVVRLSAGVADRLREVDRIEG